MKYCYEYPHPAVAVDIVVFTLIEGLLHLLLIKRKDDPHKGLWALPGGFVQMAETVEEAALRELHEETGMESPQPDKRSPCATPKLLGIYSNPQRDSRERVISIAYMTCVRASSVKLEAGTDALEAKWWPAESLPAPAFDHAIIIGDARRALKQGAMREPWAAQMIANPFRITELQEATEEVLGSPIDKRNFRRLFKERMEPTQSETFTYQPSTAEPVRGRHRPAQLFELRFRG